MARKENDLTVISITQFLRSDYWHWTDHEKQYIGDLKNMLGVIKFRLEQGGCKVSELHGIIHDKDTHLAWDSSLLSEVIVQKEPHIHCVIKFEKGATLTNLSVLIGVEPQYLEKAKKGKYGYDNILSYLTHIKYTDKYQYDPTDVFTLVGRPYADIYIDRHTDWIKGRAAIKAAKAKVDVDYLIEMILTGQVYKEQVLLTDEYFEIYSRNSNRCDDAFRVYGERRAYKTMQAMKDGDFELSVIFVTGKAGDGKSHLAKQICDSLIEESKRLGGEIWRVCQTAATNPLDEYNGEEILFMDDIRGAALTASDWLKLLDPVNISPGSARYKNKTPACRCVIITSTKTVIEFFMYCKQIGGGDKSEALDQFLRRIMACVTVFNTDGNRSVNIAIPVKTDPYLTNTPDGNRVSLNYALPSFTDTNVNFDEAKDFLSKLVVNRNNLHSKNEVSEIDNMLAAHEKIYNIDREWADMPAPDETVKQSTGILFTPDPIVNNSDTVYSPSIELLYEPPNYDE